jgi:hypothetical protein
MKTQIVIEIQNGIIQFIGTNTENITITVIDKDCRPMEFDKSKPNSVMTDEGINAYIEKEKTAEEARLTDMAALEMGE